MINADERRWENPRIKDFTKSAFINVTMPLIFVRVS